MNCQECGKPTEADHAVCEGCFRAKGFYKISEHGARKPPWDQERHGIHARRFAEIKRPPGDQTGGSKDRQITEATFAEEPIGIREREQAAAKTVGPDDFGGSDFEPLPGPAPGTYVMRKVPVFTSPLPPAVHDDGPCVEHITQWVTPDFAWCSSCGSVKDSLARDPDPWLAPTAPRRTTAHLEEARRIVAALQRLCADFNSKFPPY